MMHQPMIRVENVSKRYGTVTALQGISFEVQSGEILGFLGPNGAGKSTTMKILTSYIAPTSGRAEIAGHDIFSASLEARKKIGYLPEGNPLYKDMSVLEYLQYVADLRGLPKGPGRTQRLQTVLEQCGLQDRLGFLIGELSKGLKQRVGLAQAIVHEPDVLILDEPTSGLDPNQILEIREVIKQIGKEKTVVFSTHIMQEVQAVCSRILIIAGGQLVADGTPEQLAQSAQGQTEISVELQGPLADIRTALTHVSGIASVRTVENDHASSGNTHRFVIMAQAKQDPRAGIFAMAAEKRFVLTELVRERTSLEDIFRTLTHSQAS